MPRCILWRLGAAAGVLLFLGAVSQGTAWAGACPSPRHVAVVGAAGGPVIQRGRPAQLQFGLNHLTTDGYPSCRFSSAPVTAVATLSRSQGRQGPWVRMARSTRRTVVWTPRTAGLWWFRAQAIDPYGKVQTAIAAVLVKDGTVRLPALRPRPVRAELWSAGRVTNVAISFKRGHRGALTLPRANGWWLLRLPRRRTWARVTRQGGLRLTPAPASLRLDIGAVVRNGWELWAQHPGMPRVPVWCRSQCRLVNLPQGPVTIQIRPRASRRAQRHATRQVTVRLQPSAKNRTAISAMHLMAGRAQPPPRGWALFTAPRLRGPKRDQQCQAARPFDGPKGPAALGRALCVLKARGSRNQPARFTAQIGAPEILLRGRATAPVIHGHQVLWAETADRLRYKVGLVLLYLAGRQGMGVEEVPLRGEYGRADSVAVTRQGTVFVVGQFGFAERRRGFIAVRRARTWQIFYRPTPVRSVIPYGQGVLALDGRGIVQCGQRCRDWPETTVGLHALVTTRQGVRALTRSGMQYAIRGRRLRQATGKPPFGFHLSQVVASHRGVIGLFGPMIVGSEYHPYCVGSVVARLTPRGWHVLHRVSGERGKQLDCQDDATRPPVVMSIAVAGNTVYARRQARPTGLLPGYRVVYQFRRR